METTFVGGITYAAKALAPHDITFEKCHITKPSWFYARGTTWGTSDSTVTWGEGWADGGTDLVVVGTPNEYSPGYWETVVSSASHTFVAGDVSKLMRIAAGTGASGFFLEEMDSIVKNTDWNQLLSLNNPSERRELFIDQKISEDRSLFTLRLDGFSPVLPTSFNEGLRLSNYLTLLCLSAPVVPENNFDDLLIRYRAVCTNLIDGEPVILSEGSLSRAMRASSSVSFLLAPVIVDSLTIGDGGLVSNIPVNTVIEMGAVCYCNKHNQQPERIETLSMLTLIFRNFIAGAPSNILIFL